MKASTASLVAESDGTHDDNAPRNRVYFPCASLEREAKHCVRCPAQTISLRRSISICTQVRSSFVARSDCLDDQSLFGTRAAVKMSLR